MTRGVPTPPGTLKPKTRTMSSAVPEPLAEFIDDWRFDHRIETKSEILNDALLEWAKIRGFDPDREA